MNNDKTCTEYLAHTAERVHPDATFNTPYGRQQIERTIYALDLIADMRDRGWSTPESRTRGALAVTEFHRNGRRMWIVSDTTTGLVIDASRAMRAYIAKAFARVTT